MNRTRTDWLLLAAVSAVLLAGAPTLASDHADPMSLNVFALQEAPEANITDLHAFIVDGDGKRVEVGDAIAENHRLIVSLCVRRALRPDQAKTLDLEPYAFRIHFDLAPPVRFATPEPSAGQERDAELAAIQRDLSMQALYGGIITHPEDIADTAILEFNLDLGDRGGEPYVILKSWSASGFLGPMSAVTLERNEQPPLNAIAATAGIFDDPFIFPRFFRRNVVGIVASIPLSKLRVPPASGPVPILLWATTHKGGEQIDHVGRSLRTQLPRFGHLNDKPPSDQVRAIIQVHDNPTITEAFLGTIVSPLFAHRHYDTVPDVMIYDLRRPARFPNGRALQDDVGKTLADAGETLLLELSYAESREFPRATTNDKAFRDEFPYLAEPWTPQEIAAHAQPGSIPTAPDVAAIAPLTLDNSVWRRLFWIEAATIVVITVALLFTVRSKYWRLGLIGVAALAVALLDALYEQNLTGPVPGAAEQPAAKFNRLLLGVATIASLGLGLVFALGRRSGARSPVQEPRFPRDRQGPIADDSHTSSYQEIHRALFDPSACRPYYRVWGSPGEAPLPIYKTTFASVTADLFGLRSKEFAMVRAARRTVKTRGDLRWGADRNGFRRLVHPMGVCLVGSWKIDATAPAGYTGYFAHGKEGRVIARYSLGGNHPEGGRNRSLGLAGKIFPLADATNGATPRAHFITQEDLGGAFTNSVVEAILTNSPPVTLLKRGSGLFAFLPVIAALLRADAEPAERQLYEIAELEKPDTVPTSCPRFMRLTIAGETPFAGDEQVDFRNEILSMIYDPGVTPPSRKLVFTIEVSDAGRRTLLQRVVGQQWTPIGTLTFEEAVASYNGDFVVHFHHPAWRRDRNDPRSVQRDDLRS